MDVPILEPRVTVKEREHWSDPIHSISEETNFYHAARGDVRQESGIRHAVSERDYQRLKAGMGCPQCLTPFPAPVGIDIINLAAWNKLTSREFRWTHTKEHGMDLVRQGCCPMCGFECSPEMMALHDEGVVDGGETPAMQHELDGFQDRAAAYFKNLERANRRAGARRRKAK